MSICANILFLFSERPSIVRLMELEIKLENRLGREIPVTGSGDGYNRVMCAKGLNAVLSSDKTLIVTDNYSMNDLFDEKMWRISYTTRMWSEDIPRGPMPDYAVTLLTLLAEKDIEAVWYLDDYYTEGGDYSPVSAADVHRLLDKFIAIGER